MSNTPNPNSPAPNTPPNATSHRKPSKSASAIAALVLSIVALALSFLPIINNFAFVLVVLAVIFGIVGIVGIKKGKHSGFGIAIVALIIAVIAGAAVLGSQAMYSAAIDEANSQLDRATGDATEEILGTDVDVQLGKLFPSRAPFPRKPLVTCKIAFRV